MSLMWSKESRSHSKIPSPVLGREVPITCLWKPVEIVVEWEKAAGVPGIPLKGPTHRITQIHLLWALELGSSSKGTRDILEELNFQLQSKGWGISFLPNRSPGRSHGCFAAGTGKCHIWVSINFAETFGPSLVTFWDPAPPNFWAHLRHF